MIMENHDYIHVSLVLFHFIQQIFMETPHSNFYERTGQSQTGLSSVHLVGHWQERPRKPKVSLWEERDHHPGGYWEAMTEPAEGKKNRARWLWKNVLDMFKDTLPWLPIAKAKASPWWIFLGSQVLLWKWTPGAPKGIRLWALANGLIFRHIATTTLFLFIWPQKAWRMSNEGEKRKPAFSF